MALAQSEYEVESLLIEKLNSMGYEFKKLDDYSQVISNFREQLCKLNAKEITDGKGSPVLSDDEFDRVLTYLNGKTIYESAKTLRETMLLDLDNGKHIYIKFLTEDTSANTYQVTHQITMDKKHVNSVEYTNRYDVTLLVNGLPLVQIELKKPGVDINEAINQVNRYRRHSFKELFHYIQFFVVSNSTQTRYFANMNEIDPHGEPQNILKSLAFRWSDVDNVSINELSAFTDDFLTVRNVTEMLTKFFVVKDTEPLLMVMRPYQVYAVKLAYDRIVGSNQSLYIWHSTGSGKTLTSFKLATLLRDSESIDRIFFLIDRKDLDDQTVDEYNSFEKDCVDNTDSTKTLTDDVQNSSKKLIITTIQKMANALKNPKYEQIMNTVTNDRTVFIIDECHRSQFGKMHGDIKRHFKHAVYVGFTGTPIFKENKGSNKYTTADMFSPLKNTTAASEEELDKKACVHKYMIREAIADGNVLRFSVEYMRTIGKAELMDATKMPAGLDLEKLDDPDYCKENHVDIEGLYHDDKRIALVADDVLNNLTAHTRINADTYTALFAVDRITYLMKYYNYMKKHNPHHYRIAAIFNWQANEDLEEKASEGDIKYSRDSLAECIKDYNKMFGTTFTTDTFDAYRKDISKRMKQKDLPQIDLLLVVNMFLTGFDSKPTNTLFLDKNLVWHTLLQAYSRTNRVDKMTKAFGQVITYRNIKKAQDDALKLFSGDGNPDEFLLQSYEYYVAEWRKDVETLRSIAAHGEDAGFIIEESKQKQFVLAFREVAHTLMTLKTFGKFEWADLDVFLDEAEYMTYKNWYQDFWDKMKRDEREGRKTILADVDFEIELIRTDRINVEYILHLLKDAIQKSDKEKRKAVDQIIKDIERSDNEKLRFKRAIMKAFIEDKFFELGPDDDVAEAYSNYEANILKEKIAEFTATNGVDETTVSSLLHKYFMDTQSVADDDIRKAFESEHFGLLKMTKLVSMIRRFISNMYDTFTMEDE